MTRRFLFACLLAFVSGAAALSHQIIWTRRFVDVLGADANTFSKVIGAFFIGLAIGSALAPRFLPKAKAWRRVALAELLVGILALPALFSYALSERLFAGTGNVPWKVLLPIALISPPAVAMGMVLPLLLAVLPRPSSPNWTLRIYGINILGGVIGVLGALLFSLPRFGITRAGLLAVAFNLAVALGAALLARDGSAAPRQPEPVPAIRIPFHRLAIVAFGSGFAVLACEVIFQQQLAQVAINSIFSSGFVLVAVLVSLGVAALVLPVLLRFGRGFVVVLSGVLITSAILCSLQPFQFIFMRPNLDLLPYELPLGQYVLKLIGTASFCICPLLFAAGLLFPLTLHAARPTPQAHAIPMLLAVNGFGGWLGAEITHAFILPRGGLWASVCVIGAIYFALFAVVQVKGARVICVAGIATSLIAISFARTLPQVGVNPPERLVTVAAGREGVVATIETETNDWRILFNNSYTLGGSKAQINQERQALLPLLLHRKPGAVACLGIATGSTVAGATLHPEVQQIEAIELSPLVLAQAKAFFGPFNRQVFVNPRVRFVQEDARWIIASRTAAYDVVIGDLFLPWRTGEGRLFTVEHFEHVRTSLKPGGVFCQWLPMFQLTRSQFETIVRTFEKVFPDPWLLRGDFYSELPILGLLGGADLRGLDWNLMDDMCRRLRQAGKVSDPLMRHPEGVAMMIVGRLPPPTAGMINTLENNWLEWNAGRNIVGLKEPWFIGIACAEYVRGIHRDSQALLPAGVRAAHDAGQFFLTLEIAAKLRVSTLGDLKSQIPSRMPQTLWNDSGAAWQTWPMRIKPTPVH